jgi:hypothetical protein
MHFVELSLIQTRVSTVRCLLKVSSHQRRMPRFKSASKAQSFPKNYHDIPSCVTRDTIGYAFLDEIFPCFESRFDKIIYALIRLLRIKARVDTIVKLCCALLS